MAAPYIAEVQTARWTSDGIHKTFTDIGFRVVEWPLTQHFENQVPADAIFFSPSFSKLFGLQYKALYHNGGEFWPLDQEQHTTLQTTPWVFYCCSEVRDVADHGLALHYARLYRPGFAYREQLPATGGIFGGPGYLRWGAFYRRLKACRVGKRVRSREHLRLLLGHVTGPARLREVQQMTELLLADLEKQVLFSQRSFSG